MRRLGRISAVLVLGGVLSACAVEADTSAPATDEPTTAPATGPVRTRTIPFKKRDGSIKQVRVHDHKGWAMVGDMKFGKFDTPVMQGRSDTAERWPGGVVHYCVSDSFSTEVDNNITDAMAHIEARVPAVHFQLVSPCGPTVIVNGEMYGVLEIHSSGENNNVGRASVGYNGWGPGFVNDVEIGNEAQRGMITHELVHVLGSHHEHARPDRDQHIHVCPSNINPEYEDNWDMVDADDVTLLTPYDYHSIMHYGMTNFCNGGCLLDGECAIQTASNEVILATMKPVKDTYQETGYDDREFGNKGILTKHDINALSLMYGRPIRNMELPGDRFGAAVAIADFDQDGYDDLVVASPQSTPDVIAPSTGYIELFKGTMKALTPTKILDPEANLANDDQFGRAMAVGDFDGDGFPDLAVGVPRRRKNGQSSQPRSGAVMIFRGGQFNKANTLYACDGNPLCDTAAEGGSPIPLKHWLTLYPSDAGGTVTPTEGEEFGAALAVGDIDGNGKADLVVGAPGWNSNWGRVFAYANLSSTPASGAPTASVQVGQSITAAGPGARFGASLTTGRFGSSVRDGVVVGAPMAGAGKAFLFDGTFASFSAQILAPSGSQTGDEFGAALATGDILTGGNAELVVGAPRQDGTVATKRAGAFHVYKYSAGFPVQPNQTFKSAATSAERFGHSIITLPVKSRTGIAVGAPYGKSSGSVHTYASNGTTITTFSAPIPADRSFGAALAAGRIRHELPPMPTRNFQWGIAVGVPDYSTAAFLKQTGRVIGLVLGDRITVPYGLASTSRSPYAVQADDE